MKYKLTLMLLTAFSVFSLSLSSVSNVFADQHPDLCAVFTRTLQQGDSGDDVKRLQVVLGQEGVAYLSATGYYGPVTAAAVKTFQRLAGIYPVGKVGPQTYKRMTDLWCSAGIGNPGNIYNNNNTNGAYNSANNGLLDISIAPTASSGTNITIGWNSRNAQSCNLNNQNVQTNGTQIFQVYNETNFTISCRDLSGRSLSKTITVKPNQDLTNLPSVQVSINPSVALINTTATIYWTSRNTQSCSINNSPYAQTNTGVTVTNNYNSYSTYPAYNNSTNGSQQIYVTGNATVYTVTCLGLNGQTVSGTITAGQTNTTNIGTVGTAYIYATPQNVVTAGSPATLTWTSTNTSSCSISNSNYSTVYNGLNGTGVVYPTTTTTYTINCVATNGQNISYQTTVYVNANNTGTNITADSTTDSQNYRNQVGQTISVYCPANLSSGTIWGGPIYSDDSPICTAAVHAGLISFATGGNVNIVIGSSQNSFTSTYANGIYSQSYGYWPGSYTFTNVGNNQSISIISQTGNTVTVSVPSVYPNGGTLNWGDGQSNNVPACAYSTNSGCGNQTLSHTYTNSGTYNLTEVTTLGTAIASLQVVVNGGGTNNGNASVTVSPTTNSVGGVENISWNYSLPPTCATCGQAIPPQGVMLDLIDVNGAEVGTIKNVNSSSNPVFNMNGSMSWTIPTTIRDTRNDSIACQIINGQTICGTQIVSGNYKVRATFFTPSNACFGYCPQVSGQQVLTTVDSQQFYISANNTTNGNLNLVSQSGNSVTVSVSSVGGTINWGDGQTSTVGQIFCIVAPCVQQSTHTYSSTGTYQITYNGASLTVTVSGTNTGNMVANLYSNVSNTTYSGQAVTLTWNSTNSNTCTIYGNGTVMASNQSISGSYTTYPTTNTTYTITCTNSSNQTVTSSPVYVTVTGGTNGNVTATLSANYSTVASNQPVVLTWTSTNANYCSITGNYVNIVSNQSPNGSTTVYPSQSTNYIITCYNSNTGQNGTGFVFVTINNSNVNVTPTVTVTSNLSNVTSGQQVQLTWYSTNSNYCNILANNNTLTGQQSTGGTYLVVPTQTTTYQVNCFNSSNGQSASSYVTVTVNGNNNGNGISLISNQNRYVTVQVNNYTCSNNINWGDGTGVAGSGSCSAAYTASHQYTYSGYFTITAGSATLQVYVQ